MESIGEKIRNIRKSKGISQTAVADSCNIKQSSYANIENGKTQNITIEIGKGISKALDISFNELFDIEVTLQNKDQLESLKEQIENFKERDRYNLKIKKAVLMSFFTSFTHVSNNINMYEIEDSDIKHESLYDFTNDFKKNLIELGVFVESDFESFENK